MLQRIIPLLALLLVTGDLAAQQPAKSAIVGKRVQRFQMNPLHVNLGTIASVKPDGTVTVSDLGNPRFILNRSVSGKTDLTEGRYLGFVAKDFVESTKDMRLVTLLVIEVQSGNKAVARVSTAAAKQIKPGEDILFFRPPNSTTAELKSAPGVVKVDDGVKTSVLGQSASMSRASMATSKNNLKQLGLAFHNFHESYGYFPPAVVYGPDGKPWHSWRVLILPYIEQSALYRRYRFDEPWNGPNNSKLLKNLPEVYRNSGYADEGKYYTHFAVISGDGTIFPTEGMKMKKKSDAWSELKPEKPGGRLRDITDGSSNTVMAGLVGPEHKIPWMKPADVVFSKKFPAFGKKGSFAAPYKSSAGSMGLFLFADGRVTTLRSTLDMKSVRNLMQRNDNNFIGEFDDRDRPGRGRSGPQAMQYVEILKTTTGFTARLVSGEK